MKRKSRITKIMYITAGLLIVELIFVWGCEKYYGNSMCHTGKSMISMDTEQKYCPISGNPINKQYYTEYMGKKVYFCSTGCIQVFEKNPEKYLSKLPQFQEMK